MGNYFGVVAPTGYSQNGAGDGPKSSRNKRSGAGKEKAAKRAVTETAGTTVGDTGTTAGTTDVGGTTTDASGVPGTTAALSTTGGVPPATTPLGGTKKATNTEVTGGSGVTKTKNQTVAEGTTVTIKPPEQKRVPTALEIFGPKTDDYPSKWRPWKGPFRIKTTQLTPEEQAKFKRHLGLIFSREIVLGTRVNFDGDDVMEVLTKAIPYLESEPVLIEDVPFVVSIVGDLHGQLFDLCRVFHEDDKDGKPGWERGNKYVFLGNYVDRGRQSLEVIMALFCLKMLYPDNIFLLRGNHEFINTNMKDGFCEEIIDRYEPEDAKIIYFQANETFSYLSIAAIVGNDYLCVHAGISPGLITRRMMRGIYKPIVHSTEDVIVHDMVWSDPARGLEGTLFNNDRNTSVWFGFDTLAIFFATMQIKAVFRGHTQVAEGYESHWGVCYTIFTASTKRHKGAVALIDAKGKLSLRVFEMDPRRVLIEKQLKQQTKAK